MYKLDLKDAYLSVPLSQDDRKRVMFRWERTLYEFLCLCFGLAPAPYVFTKLLKIPMALSRSISIRIIIYLDDMLIIGRTKEETIALRDTVNLLLQCLGFFISQKKSVMTPVQEIQFLGMIVNSKVMIICLPQKKLQSIKQMCQDIYQNAETTVLELTKVLGQLKSTILAIVPAKLHCRFLQQQQIQVLKKNGSYESRVLLNKESQLELLWWVKNIEICNGRTLIQLSAQVLLQTDASLTF